MTLTDWTGVTLAVWTGVTPAAVGEPRQARRRGQPIARVKASSDGAMVARGPTASTTASRVL
jgi:hypothetical protein